MHRTSWANSWKEFIRKQREDEDAEWRTKWTTFTASHDSGAQAEHFSQCGGNSKKPFEYVLKPGPFGMPIGMSSKDWFKRWFDDTKDKYPTADPKRTTIANALKQRELRLRIKQYSMFYGGVTKAGNHRTINFNAPLRWCFPSILPHYPYCSRRPRNADDAQVRRLLRKLTDDSIWLSQACDMPVPILRFDNQHRTTQDKEENGGDIFSVGPLLAEMEARVRPFAHCRHAAKKRQSEADHRFVCKLLIYGGVVNQDRFDLLNCIGFTNQHLHNFRANVGGDPKDGEEVVYNVREGDMSDGPAMPQHGDHTEFDENMHEAWGIAVPSRNRTSHSHCC